MQSRRKGPHNPTPWSIGMPHRFRGLMLSMCNANVKIFSYYRYNTINNLSTKISEIFSSLYPSIWLQWVNYLTNLLTFLTYLDFYTVLLPSIIHRRLQTLRVSVCSAYCILWKCTWILNTGPPHAVVFGVGSNSPASALIACSSCHPTNIMCTILADRTNGRAIGTVLRPLVVVVVVVVCDVMYCG